jgi:Ca-activated chloride channel homolog
VSWWSTVRFATPWMLVVAVLAPLAVAVVAWADRARRRALVGRLGEHALIQRMMVAASPARRRIKRVLLGAAVGLIALAAARPQTPGTGIRRGHGLDLVIALDASKSMMVGDVGGPRLDQARALIAKLLAKLDGDRYGSVVFAGAAAHFPLTHDREVALTMLGELGPLDLPPGSDLAGALKTATCILRPDEADVWSGECARVGGSGTGGDPLPEERGEGLPTSRRAPRALEERGKVVLVLTDGGGGLRRANGRVDLAPVEQVRRAVGLGVTVLVMGVGTESGGRVPALDDRGRVTGDLLDREGRPVTSKLDRESLGLLADAAGGVDGHYFELGAGAVDPAPLIAALGRVKRGELEARQDRVMIEHYPAFLFVGFMLLVIEACIGTRRRVKHPEEAA